VTGKIGSIAAAALLWLAGCGLEPQHGVPAPTRPSAQAPAGSMRASTPVASQAETPRLDELYPPRTAPARSQPAGQTTPAPVAAASGGEGEFTLNFEQAELRDVVRVVLGELLKVNYVIDPALTGAVTLRTERPLTRAALLPALEAVLATRGASLVRAGELYRVSANTTAGLPGGVPGAVSGQAFQVFSLAYVAAAELRKALEATLPRGRVVELEGARNVVVVSGTSEDLALAREAVRILDVDQMAGQGVLLVGLDHAEAATVTAELDNLFASGAKGGLAGVVRFIAIPRLNAVMAVSAQQRYLDEARSWIQRLDRTRHADERQLFVYHMQHGKAGDMARTLRGLFAAEAGPPVQAPVARAETPAAQPGGAPALAARSAPVVSNQLGAAPPPAAVVPVSDYGRSGLTILPRAAELSADAGNGPIRISADPVTNALLVSATPRDYARVQEAVQQLDLMPLQVLLEASIVEVTLRDQLRYGVQYMLKNGGIGIADSGRAILSGAANLPIQATLPGFAFTLASGGEPRVIIDALSEVTDIKVVSSPRLLVLDNQVARLQVGDVVPIVIQSATSTLTNNPLIVNAVQYRDTGVTLEITPRVTASGLITLEIGQEVSDVQRTTTSNIDSPTIRQRRLLTTVAVQSGETILLGGLIREENNAASSGIPVLRDIPVLGNLFGSTDNRAQRTELIVLVNPRVLRNVQEARDATQDTLRQFQNLVDLRRDGLKQPRRAAN
jgi:general secretion pathway protein D